MAEAIGSAEMEPMSFVKGHPFWTLLIVAVVLALLDFLLFGVGGHGTGGLDLGPIQPDK